ncbi:N-6 DNA methylase [Micromonospora sp. NBC_01739]|uniref:N-6 DNA methylase n=1 Tax=Micromonospora sp. NBC_01739 TaxID=2975985 RepID=UPI002E10D788|nr:N-6 DNA methylase [Micromonospora sp. NBC_01739]
MTESVPAVLQAIRANLNLTQTGLADRLGVSFATVNRWEGGGNRPQRAPMARILELAAEAGVDVAEVGDAPAVMSRRRRAPRSDVNTTKPMEQMLWDAACSIRGEKDAAKFKDYLLPLLFLKRLSDVFDDEISRLADEYGDHDLALEIAEADTELLRFYLPPGARWDVISGRKPYDWPLDERGRSTAPKDIGEHLTKAVRAVVRYNPTLSGVIDVIDFAAERNGERDINPAKLRGVVEAFSDPRYRLGLADVQPDFLGRSYEYLLRKFAEGSGQSAGEFFTPTEVGFLMARILRPRPGETCHDFTCGSGGLLIKLQLVARELDPTSKVPLKMYGQELQAESYAVARMNTIIHDMDVDLQRGDTMINPKFRDSAGRLQRFDVVVANPMWNQAFDPSLFEEDPYDRFTEAGGVTSGKGDWAWLQHALAVMNDGGRAAVVLDTGTLTRGSGSRNEDRERNIRKWFVDHDYVEGAVLLPDNLFYNTNAAGIIIFLSKRKPAARKGKVLMLNASRRFTKGRPKNFLSSADVLELARIYQEGVPVDGELAVVDVDDIVASDYNLSPARWAARADQMECRTIAEVADDLTTLERRDVEASLVLEPLIRAAAAPGGDTTSASFLQVPQKDSELGPIPKNWELRSIGELCEIWSGGTPRKSVPEFWVGDIPWVSGKDLKAPVIDDAIDHVSEAGVYSGSRLAPADSVLLLVRGMGLAKDLPVAAISRPMAFNQDVKALVLKGQFKAYPGRFLRSAIYSGKQRLLGRIVPSAHGTMTLNLSDVESLVIAWPTDPEDAYQIVRVLSAVEEKVRLQRQKGVLFDELFGYLLSHLMSGEIGLSNIDRLALPIARMLPNEVPA